MTRQHKDCLLYGELSIGLVILVETDNKYYLIENFVPLQGNDKGAGIIIWSIYLVSRKIN